MSTTLCPPPHTPRAFPMKRLVQQQCKNASNRSTGVFILFAGVFAMMFWGFVDALRDAHSRLKSVERNLQEIAATLRSIERMAKEDRLPGNASKRPDEQAQ